ncbi:hypothetical protein IC744_16360 [Microbacterium hominis]|uniref:hypothetical protein n=1 Tax=Microbacterium TaxID=33882 RepID=UPI00168A7C38|nr:MULTISPECIES: hypothetical protein [Microbacterium]QOC24835.1 hypothetical protein IC745_10610 [Microbacterium hominis]QOC28888.1 hypothetical protein IC744_16360 [Microbacterium hominis]QYF98913.1 hypothetical protein KY498_06785 [Microbacterium sp. PAMC21962]
MGESIVIIDGIRYRREDALARGLLTEARGSGRALSLTAAQIDVDALVEARVADHEKQLDSAHAERSKALEAEFDERVSAAVEEKLAERITAALAERDGAADAGNAEPVKPANRSAKPATK